MVKFACLALCLVACDPFPCFQSVAVLDKDAPLVNCRPDNIMAHETLPSGNVLVRCLCKP